MDDILSENEKTWDVVADQFAEASALPVWGPFGVGDDLNLITDITNKTFLEIGCGSGRSIKYLNENGAKKVYGLDISSVQLEEASKFNNDDLAKGKVEFIKGRMEDKLNIEPIDIIFSVYAIGWTSNPENTLKNIYSYLKPGGQFIWSWDHTIFSDIVYKDGEFCIKYSYHEENLITIKNWKNTQGLDAYITYRKTSTWFKLLRDAGFEIVGYYEPEPKNIEWGSNNPERYYSIQKAEKIPATFIFVCKK
ncbi:MAG TPA: class I SAM-dependent methyltransferase [Candidatus Paceibacterota bacterium]